MAPTSSAWRSSPSGCAAPARLPDRPGCRRCSARRALPRCRGAPRAAGCTRRARVGRIEQQAMREPRAPAGGQLPVLALDVVDDRGPGQVSRVGTTRPTPLPERVGAKAITCSGPSCRRCCVPWRPRKMPAGSSSPALQSPAPRPAGRAIGRDQRRLPCAAHRAGNRNDDLRPSHCPPWPRRRLRGKCQGRIRRSDTTPRRTDTVGRPTAVRNQAGPSAGWKPRRMAVHSVAPHRPARTAASESAIWPQRIFVPVTAPSPVRSSENRNRRSTKSRAIREFRSGKAQRRQAKKYILGKLPEGERTSVRSEGG